MPWTSAQAHEHKKGMNGHQAEVWARVANQALKACQEKGGEDCDASAIRQANSAVNNLDSNDDGIRFDAGEIVGRGQIDPDTGFLHVNAKVTRTGVLTYRFPDGSTRREFRSPSEVGDNDSLASLKLRPTTNDHPYSEPRLLVTSENAKRLQVGHAGEDVKFDGKWVTVPLVVTDGATIKEIQSGKKKQLSCGYRRQLLMQSGSYEGESYDCEQILIRYNHIAHVGSARVGAEASISLDAKDAVEDVKEIILMEDSRMIKVVLDGISYDAAPEVQLALNKKDQEISSLKASIEASKKITEGMQAVIDSSKTEIDKLKLASSDEVIKEKVKARAALQTNAARFLPSDTKLDGLSDNEIKTAVIKAVNKDVSLDGKSESYVDAAYDYVVQSNPEKKPETTAADSKVTIMDSAKAREKMLQEQRDAWKATA